MGPAVLLNQFASRNSTVANHGSGTSLVHRGGDPARTTRYARDSRDAVRAIRGAAHYIPLHGLQELAHSHGGGIMKRNEAGGGAPAAGTAARKSGRGSQQPTVLIVDDDATARLALAAIIAPDEHHVTFATNAADLRARLPLIDPDVIICDLVMEGMSGDALFRWMQADERWCLVPIIGVTRMDSPVVRADLLHAGADAVLVKPCSGPELRAHVQAALRTRRKYVRLGRLAAAADARQAEPVAG
jgi:CheY-like chemotaxis protein